MKANQSTGICAACVGDMQPFERLLVLGCGGAGKSTLAAELGELTGLPVVHLDRLFWLPGWTHRTRDEFDALLADELAKPRWIMDGDYNRTLSERLKWCDAVVLLDYSGIVCAAGIIKRRLMHRGKSRASMAEGCNERLDGNFVRWVLNYRRKVRPGHIELLHQAADREQPPQIFILKNRKQARRWLTVAGAIMGALHPDTDQLR